MQFEDLDHLLNHPPQELDILSTKLTNSTRNKEPAHSIVTQTKNSVISSNGPYMTTSDESHVARISTYQALPALKATVKPSATSSSDTKAPETAVGWFNMPAPELTAELKRDLHIIKNRSVLDPKRHYKKDNNQKTPKFFQIGTIIGGSADWFNRLDRKQRKDTIIEELMADHVKTDYFQRKFSESQKRKIAQAPAWFKRRMEKGHKKQKL